MIITNYSKMFKIWNFAARVPIYNRLYDLLIPCISPCGSNLFIKISYTHCYYIIQYAGPPPTHNKITAIHQNNGVFLHTRPDVLAPQSVVIPFSVYKYSLLRALVVNGIFTRA